MVNTKITAWSYSRLRNFEECARQFMYRNIKKLKEPKAAPMMRGIAIHNELARWLTDREQKRLPMSGLKFMAQFIELRGMTPIVEQKWAFTKKMKPTGWFSKDCWLRVTLDIGLVYKDGWGEAIDLKTGKKYDDYEDQLNLFAHALIKMNPREITNGITVRLWYLDVDDESENEVIRDVTVAEAAEHFEKLTERAEIMMSAKKFPPNPSWKCGGTKKDGTEWGCHWRASNGGPCEYG